MEYALVEFTEGLLNMVIYTIIIHLYVNVKVLGWLAKKTCRINLFIYGDMDFHIFVPLKDLSPIQS